MVVLDFAVKIAVLILVLVFVPVLAQAFLTLRNLGKLINDVNNEFVPILVRLQATVEEVNSELSQVEGIVSSIQVVSERIQSITRILQEVLASPLIKLAGFSAGSRKAFGSLFGRSK